MPMGPADLTLVKLNSVLGGKGGEWGSESGPSGAALPVEIRSKSRELGNAGQPAAAAELLLQHALAARVQVPLALLTEIQQNIVPLSPNQAGMQQLISQLQAISAGGAGRSSASGKKPSVFSKLFGRK